MGCPDRAIDFLVPVLTHVADPEVAVRAVEGPAPRIAEAAGEDLIEAGRADVRVRGGHRVALRARGVTNINREQLAEQAVQALGAIAGVAGAAAVAHPDAEVAVPPERKVPAV